MVQAGRLEEEEVKEAERKMRSKGRIIAETVVGWWEHQKLLSRMMSSAEGGAGFLHRVTKPAARRGGLQTLEGFVGGDVKALGNATPGCNVWRMSRGGI